VVADAATDAIRAALVACDPYCVDSPFIKQQLPDAASEPCVRFLDGTIETTAFVFFVTGLVTRADEVQRIATQALLNVNPDQEATEKESLEKNLSEESVLLRQLRRHRQLIFQMLVTRSVDDYLAYVSELLSTIFLARPETLRSKEEVEVEFVLRHDSMDDLVRALAERRVERLAYAGLPKLAKELRASPGLELFGSDADLLRAVKIVEDRNLIVHNRAVVNSVYLRKVPTAGIEAGDHLEFEFDDVFADIEFLTASALATDQLASAKWDLPQMPVAASG
jgi:hypothetical protein